jgi:hypothetical protein
MKGNNSLNLNASAAHVDETSLCELSILETISWQQLAELPVNCHMLLTATCCSLTEWCLLSCDRTSDLKTSVAHIEFAVH